jgi:hypothetical protein
VTHAEKALYLYRECCRAVWGCPSAESSVSAWREYALVASDLTSSERKEIHEACDEYGDEAVARCRRHLEMTGQRLTLAEAA